MTYKGKVFVLVSGVKEVVKSIHKGHMGTVKCQDIAQQTMFWPTMVRDINRNMGECDICRGREGNSLSTPL